ncbi:MAG: hypothetical protein WCA98_16285 [Candidatus Acidiferrales bacterium]
MTGRSTVALARLINVLQDSHFSSTPHKCPSGAGEYVSARLTSDFVMLYRYAVGKFRASVQRELWALEKNPVDSL